MTTWTLPGGCDAALRGELCSHRVKRSGTGRVAPVRASIAAMRGQVERLRRMKSRPRQREDWSGASLLASGSPWTLGGDSPTEQL